MSSARVFSEFLKDLTASSVHVDGALGGQGKRKARSFKSLRGEAFDRLDSFAKRDLQPHDDTTAKSPFLYDPNALGSLRPDQVPRFFGALTDSEKLPEADVPLADLHAMQDRVDPVKVKAIRESGVLPAKLPVVVKHNGKHYIADGHHRLAAQWLDGETTAKVRLKDLEPVTSVLKRGWVPYNVAKVDADRQEIFGWASVVTKGGQIIIDKQGHAIPPEEMEPAVYNFVLNYRDQGHMHEQLGVGRMIESMMFTKQKQDVLGIDLGMEAWWIGFKVDNSDVWAEHRAGRLPEFSIGGSGVLSPSE